MLICLKKSRIHPKIKLCESTCPHQHAHVIESVRCQAFMWVKFSLSLILALAFSLGSPVSVIIQFFMSIFSSKFKFYQDISKGQTIKKWHSCSGNYLTTSNNHSSVGCLKCMQLYIFFRLNKKFHSNIAENFKRNHPQQEHTGRKYY